ncbi:hypothetical protein Vadar_023895 [Vaccinium darrowii]|uniref:Uncharacterized protein n=1 Tax=Vaccinium darrowii TaxID=229202 RepID=A0ACB7Z6B5_9ERIC|nr:hypothetical protein Vadar_023895 [Vaccinium darrowii]
MAVKKDSQIQCWRCRQGDGDNEDGDDDDDDSDVGDDDEDGGESVTMKMAVKNRDNAFIPRSRNARKCRHRHVKVVAGRIAPPSAVIRRAKIGGSYGHYTAAETPLGVELIVARDSIASTTCLAPSEERTTYCCCVRSKSGVECVIVTTSST